jgi:hypothetical protein
MPASSSTWTGTGPKSSIKRRSMFCGRTAGFAAGDLASAHGLRRGIVQFLGHRHKGGRCRHLREIKLVPQGLIGATRETGFEKARIRLFARQVLLGEVVRYILGLGAECRAVAQEIVGASARGSSDEPGTAKISVPLRRRISR